MSIRGMLVGLLISFLLLAGCLLFVKTNVDERNACEEQGGRIQEVHTPKGTGWFCDMRGKAER